GMGATTEFQYDTIQHLDLEAARLGAPWTHHSPAVIPVVTKITTRNTVPTTGTSPEAVQQPYYIHRSVEYQYRDPAWDPWFHKALGFRKVRIRTGIDQGVTEITRWFGPCQRLGSPCSATMAEMRRTMEIDWPIHDSGARLSGGTPRSNRL